MKEEVIRFIEENKHKSSSEIALLLSKKPHLPKQFIIDQINGRQRAIKKFPFLLDKEEFKFPNSRAVEQSSSEYTAQYKSSFLSGNTLIDLSGGMGLDSFFFSKQFKNVHYIEQNEELFEITNANFKNALQLKNIETYNTSAEEFLVNHNDKVDLVYLDPDRRISKNKAFRIEDCEPNIVELFPLIWERTNVCLIKLSPMLDISQAVSQLNFCKKVFVISYGNECKELLFLLEKGFTGEPQIVCNEILQKQEFEFNFSDEKSIISDFDEPRTFLYEPNVSILKAGAFKSVAKKYGLQKLEVNTHFYTSINLIKDFPGKIFELIERSKPKKGLINKANVISRNFPLSPSEIKKKYKITDGGDYFLYACSLQEAERAFILCKKVN